MENRLAVVNRSADAPVTARGVLWSSDAEVHPHEFWHEVMGADFV